MKTASVLEGVNIVIVRNIQDQEVMETTYLAHGGAVAQMILDSRVLREIGFLAIARLAPGKEIEAHVDPMEEIYFVLSGTGEMTVDQEKKEVGPADAVWVPTGAGHALLNTGTQDCIILVVASPFRQASDR
ncbi:MAG: cupin domain-containing protein [Desulfatiglandaceae bacterium]